MKQLDKRELIQTILVVLILGGATIGVLLTADNKPNVECTTQYVQEYGEKDCENFHNKSESDSENFQDSIVR